MKTDDPVPSPRCFGEGENYSLHPGGMLCGPPCPAPAPHLISTSLAGFFLFSILMAVCLPLPEHPTISAGARRWTWCSRWEAAEPGPGCWGCRPRRWDKLGEDSLQILAAHGGKRSRWGSPQPEARSSLTPPLTSPSSSAFIPHLLFFTPCLCFPPASTHRHPSARTSPPRGRCRG